MIIQILVSIFALFAASRAYLRFKDGALHIIGFILWILLWTGITFFVWWPKASDVIALNIGIGRGVDALVYISIVALFYGMFRIYVKLEFIEKEITSLVRDISLQEIEKKNSTEKRK